MPQVIDLTPTRRQSAMSRVGEALGAGLTGYMKGKEQTSRQKAMAKREAKADERYEAKVKTEADRFDRVQTRLESGKGRGSELAGLKLEEARRKAAEALKPYAETRAAEKAAYQASLVKEKQTPDKFKAAGFAKRARLATQDLTKLPSDIGTDWAQGMAEYTPDFMKGEDQKLFEQTKNNFISAVLRRESGAAISDAEYDRENAKYFPQANDTERVLVQKERAREQAMLNLEGEAGKTSQMISDAPQIQEQAPMGQPQGLMPLGISEAQAGDAVKNIDTQIKAMSRAEKLKLIRGN